MVSASVNDSINDSTNKPVEMVNHPRHYNREGGMECLDEMVLIFGREATMHFCLLNAWKYRYRAGSKENGAQDLAKSDFYINKYKELVDSKTADFKIDKEYTQLHPVSIMTNGDLACDPDLAKRMSLARRKSHD